MEVQALTRYARMSPKKVREITRIIQGRPASAALDYLNLIPRKSARLIAKTLKSAIANAENNHQLDVDRLVVTRAEVGKSVVMRRFQARGRGRAARVEKWFSHLKIVVAERVQETTATTAQEAA